ncbi:MAG: hypothetical protein II969_00435 [Anaerolineaceae bacterium]|nr:hypothetical protein [Anaerolineaceae bacterium]
MNKSNHTISFLCQAAVHTAALTLFLLNTVSVRAETWGSGQINSIFEILKDMTDLYIKIAYGAMILVFVVGTVKSGLGAQAAQTLNLPKKVSNEIANFALGIAVFIFGVLSYPIAEKIINTVIGSAGSGSVTGLHLDF